MDARISMYAIPGLKFQEALPKVSHFNDTDQRVKIIIDAVCNFFKLDVNRIHTKTRKREVVLARQIMHKLIKENTRLTLKTIGQKIHNGKPMDHTTVIHSINTVRDLMDSDRLINQQVRQIESIIYS